MNEFRLQTSIQLKYNYLSLHPAGPILQTMIPPLPQSSNDDGIDDSFIEMILVEPSTMPKRRNRLVIEQHQTVIQVPVHDKEEDQDDDEYEVHNSNTTAEEFI